MDCHIALFLATLIRLEGANFAYTDKWQKKVMEKSILHLPCKGQAPDWNYMAQFIKNLSANLIAQDYKDDSFKDSENMNENLDNDAPEEPQVLPEAADENWKQ